MPIVNRVPWLISLVACAGLWLFSVTGARSMDGCPDAVQDYAGSCGHDRGMYVLRPNGVSLWVSSSEAGKGVGYSDTNAQLRIREPVNGFLQERVLMDFGDLVDLGYDRPTYLGGINSNPHVNSRGEAIWIASTDYPTWDTSKSYAVGDSLMAVMLSEPGKTPYSVANVALDLGGEMICGSGLQPFPQIGEGGDYVFSAEVRDIQGLCSAEEGGDALPTDALAQDLFESENKKARITRVEMSLATATSRTLTVHYEELDGKTVGETDKPWLDNLLDWPGYVSKAGISSGVNICSQPGVSIEVDSEAGTLTCTFGADVTRQTHQWCAVDSACDLDLVAAGRLNYIWDGTQSTDPRNVTSEGVRAIYRGSVGGGVPQQLLRGVSQPSSAETQVSSLVVDSSNTSLATPDHPAAVDGTLTYWLRNVTAISHSGTMVGADGAAVVSGSVQAAPASPYWSRDDAATMNNKRDLEWNQALIYVDPAGNAALAANAAAETRYGLMSGPVLTSEPGVLYRASQRDYDEDFGGTNKGFFQLGGVSGAPTGTVPTGAGVARAGDWPILLPNFRFYDMTDPNNPAFVFEEGTCKSTSYVSNWLMVGSDSPSSADDYRIRTGGCWKYYSDPTHRQLILDGKLAIRLDQNDIYDTQGMTELTENDPIYAYFPIDASWVHDLGEYRVTFPLQLRWWNAANNATSVVMDNRQDSPAGFSKLLGIPKHFSEGGGVIGFRTRLSPPALGYAGGVEGGDNPYGPYDPNDPENTILGDDDPCGLAWGAQNTPASYGGIDSGDPCHAIYVSVDGELTEVARTASAEFVFRSEDDPEKIGATGVEGFTFVEFGAAVAVSEAGTVFFNAQTIDEPGDGWGADSEGAGACTNSDLPEGYGDNRHGVFAYADGVVSKVIAEGDVVTSGGVEGMVTAIALPQPALRQAVAGNSILLKVAADTTGDCVSDTIGLMQATTAEAAAAQPGEQYEYAPNIGVGGSLETEQGGTVQLVVLNPETGWRVTDFDLLDPALANYLEEEDMSGGLFSFRAVYKPTDGAPTGTPAEGEETLQLALLIEAEPDRVSGLLKDMEAKPDLIDSLTETENGFSRIQFSVTDIVEEGVSGLDFDPQPGIMYDPFGASLVPRVVLPVLPLIPVPALGQFFLLILTGLTSLLGGLFMWRRGAA